MDTFVIAINSVTYLLKELCAPITVLSDAVTFRKYSYGNKFLLDSVLLSSCTLYSSDLRISVKERLYTYSRDFSTENLCDPVCGAGYSAAKSRLFGNIHKTTESP
jgi:hypothetical protein